jgi:hypothetical protein
VVEPVRAEKLGAITTRGTLVREPWSGNHPSLVWEPPSLWSFAGLFCGRPAPLFSFVNVNPHTRLSHMTPFSGRDWCTRERCRLMMQNSQIFPEFLADDPQDFAAGSRIPQDFPKVGGSSTPPPPTPLRPGACCTEASCVTHWILVRDPLKSTEACPGELTPHHSPMDQGSCWTFTIENSIGIY